LRLKVRDLLFERCELGCVVRLVLDDLGELRDIGLQLRDVVPDVRPAVDKRDHGRPQPNRFTEGDVLADPRPLRIKAP
jgi:hypothetical protein